VKVVEIYGLYCPDTGELRYVGKANNAQKRLKKHLFERVKSRPVNRWVKSLVDSGKAPVLKILETVPHDEWEEAERRLIAEHRKAGKLLNLADGGAMPSQTKAQRKKAAIASNEAQRLYPEAWKRLQSAKKDLGRMLARAMKDGDYAFAARLRFRLRLDAANRPDLYGSWASL
jgi:hypothetical protein